MSTLSSLRLGRRPVRSRVVVLYRMTPHVARELLPEHLRPRLVQGYAVATLAYTRLGSLESRFLPQRRASTHHLAVRIAAERPVTGASAGTGGGASGGTGGSELTTWVAHRRTSSRLGTRWGGRILRRESGHARFVLEESPFGLSLHVQGPQAEELALRLETCARAGSLFATPRAVEELLETSGAVRPHDVLAPEADAIDCSRCFAPEPLGVFELRSAFLDDPATFPPGSVELDGAWRLAPKRLQPVQARSTERVRARLAAGEAFPAV
jgi:hypothetical protein